MDTLTSDPELYGSLIRPFDGIERANEALRLFWEDVRAARKKHGIPDTYVIVRLYVAGDDGNARPAITTLQCGDRLQAIPMLGYAIGQEQDLYDEYVSRHTAIGKASKASQQDKGGE